MLRDILMCYGQEAGPAGASIESTKETISNRADLGSLSQGTSGWGVESGQTACKVGLIETVENPLGRVQRQPTGLRPTDSVPRIGCKGRGRTRGSERERVDGSLVLSDI